MSVSRPAQPRHFGERRLTLSLGGLLVSEHEHAPLEQLPMHVHEEPYLCLVTAGAYSESTASRVTNAHAGALLGHAPGERHANAFGAAGGRCLNITPTGDWRGNACWEDWFEAPAAISTAVPPAALLRVQRELAIIDAVRPLGVAAALFELLHLARETRAADGPASWLRRVREAIDADPVRGWGLDALARECGVHPSTLARAFRAWTGDSLGAYVRRRRLEFALELIARDAAPLAEIALRAGFTDQAHLTRAVRAAQGVTPRAYKIARRVQGAQDHGQ